MDWQHRRGAAAAHMDLSFVAVKRPNASPLAGRYLSSDRLTGRQARCATAADDGVSCEYRPSPSSAMNVMAEAANR